MGVVQVPSPRLEGQVLGLRVRKVLGILALLRRHLAPDDVGPVPLIARIGKGEGRPRAAWWRSEDWACRVSLSSLLLFLSASAAARTSMHAWLYLSVKKIAG